MLGLLVRGQAQRTDMRTMGLAGQHVGPLEILVADMASQHRGRGLPCSSYMGRSIPSCVRRR